MDSWLEQHIESHLSWTGKAHFITDKGERIGPYTVEIDLFDINEWPEGIIFQNDEEPAKDQP